MIGSVKLLIIFGMMQFGFISGCFSLSAEASSGQASPTPTPETRVDCDNPETGWKIDKLNGRVKSLRVEEIEYGYGSRKRELIRLVTFGPSGDYIKDDERLYFRLVDYSKIKKPTFVFDKDCRVLERQDPKRHDRMAGATRRTFSYTTSGTLKEEAIYDLEGRLLWKSVATLDKNERITETNEKIQEHPEHFKPERLDVYRHTRSTYELDDVGNQIVEVSYDWKGNLYATYKRAYDSARRLIRELRVDHRNRPVTLNIYNFDKSGILREEFKFNSSNYSNIDELIPGKLDSGYGMFQDGDRILYEFDDKNNWIKKTQFDLAGTGKVSRITYRTLVYY